MRMLLARNNVNPDRVDKDGETPLSEAALSGYEGNVQMLGARGDVNPDITDKDGRTLLSWVADDMNKEKMLELMEADSCFTCSGRKDRRNGFWLCLSFVQSTEVRRQKGITHEGEIDRCGRR